MANVLIIDDDPQIRRLMGEYLAREGHEVSTAEDGKRGIKQLTARRFDLVITDIVMPEADGLEVLMWLRANPDRPKVIAISGGSASLDLDLLLKSASFTADRVLAKPVMRETLMQTVSELLTGEPIQHG